MSVTDPTQVNHTVGATGADAIGKDALGNDMSQALCEQIRNAFASQTPLNIQGGASRGFLGRSTATQSVDVSAHRGILNYEPTELVIHARAGTTLIELEAALAEAGQTLPFDPPRFGVTSTLGGATATGLSGPARPWTGSARDYVLGITCINGSGQLLKFGGQVMKNVAGYDLSRLMTGACGTLGVITDVSLKVLPKPEQEATCCFELTSAQAVSRINQLAATPLPLSGACYRQGILSVRLSGTVRGVTSAVQKMGGDVAEHGTDEGGQSLWTALRDLSLPELSETPLWRLSVPPATRELDMAGKWVIDWGGAQRWFCPHESNADAIRALAADHGGHATLIRGGNDQDIDQENNQDDNAGHEHNHGRDVKMARAHPPAAGIVKLHERLKDAFDPARILNPGRLYASL